MFIVDTTNFKINYMMLFDMHTKSLKLSKIYLNPKNGLILYKPGKLTMIQLIYSNGAGLLTFCTFSNFIVYYDENIVYSNRASQPEPLE